jgi:tripartite-type tricarboxylate transporter receptor subunit TctC
MKASIRSKAATPRRWSAFHGNERRLVTEHARRRILSLAAGAAVMPAVSRMAWGQAYPTRPVRIIVGFTPGAATDFLARLIGGWLSERLGRRFVIENRPGAGTMIATEAVARAPADGHTLLLISAANAISALTYDKIKFSLTRDIAPVAGISREPYVMLVHPSVPATKVSEFIAYAKANPGKINMASAGIGSGGHLAGDLFRIMADINMVHVPYRGGAPAFTALLAGEVQLYFAPINSSLGYLNSGSLRGLAVTTPIRSEMLPNLPAIDELLSSYEATAWYGIGAPKNTSGAIIAMLNREINAGLSDVTIKIRLFELGATPLAGSPAAFGKLIADETEKWAGVIRTANIKAE